MTDASSNKTPRKKTDRKMVVWVAVIGMLMLIVYLFGSQGSDLGQAEVQQKKAEKDAAAEAERYSAKIENPQAATQASMAEAREQARKKQAQEAAAQQQALEGADTKGNLADQIAPPDDDGFPPPEDSSNDVQYRRLERGAKDVNSNSGVAPDGTGAPGASVGTRPSFVVFEAAPPKKGDGSVRDALKLDNGAQQPDVDSQAPVTQADIDNANDPRLKAAYQRLAAAQARQAGMDKLLTGSAEQLTAPNGEANEAWLYRDRNSKVPLDEPIVAKRTQALYWLAPGTIIHGVIQNAIDTRLPGTITVRVTQAVYDSRYGRYMVIPAGSVLKGSYNSDVADGQHRAMLGFDTLITPSGGLVDLGSLPGADNLGMSGVEGKLHTHFAQRMGIAALLALEAVGMDRLERPKQVLTPYGSGDSQSISSGAQIIVNAANEEVKRRSNVGPNITVKAGELMTVTLASGIEIPPIANAR